MSIAVDNLVYIFCIMYSTKYNCITHTLCDDALKPILSLSDILGMRFLIARNNDEDGGEIFNDIHVGGKVFTCLSVILRIMLIKSLFTLILHSGYKEAKSEPECFNIE